MASVDSAELTTEGAPHYSGEIEPVDADAWEKQADKAASDFLIEIRALEDEVMLIRSMASYGPLWPRMADLSDRIRTAPAIKLDDKLAFRRQLNALRERVKRDQKALKTQMATCKAEISDSLDLVREALTEATTVREVQDLRADLTSIRIRIEKEGLLLGRQGRQELWARWQAHNQTAWELLNNVWENNGHGLRSILEDAQVRLAGGEPGAVRERVKEFHTVAQDRETSRRTLQELQALAGQLWHEADALAKKKHEAFLAYSGRRTRQWKAQRIENERTQKSLAHQIEDLERRSLAATSDVGAALLRGQLMERRKTLERLESEDRALQVRIQRAESIIAKD
ncbi:MAG: hypothetical protein NVSMB52_17350 [Chloroflexota bacterium]